MWQKCNKKDVWKKGESNRVENGESDTPIKVMEVFHLQQSPISTARPSDTRILGQNQSV